MPLRRPGKPCPVCNRTECGDPDVPVCRTGTLCTQFGIWKGGPKLGGSLRPSVGILLRLSEVAGDTGAESHFAKVPFVPDRKMRSKFYLLRMRMAYAPARRPPASKCPQGQTGFTK